MNNLISLVLAISALLCGLTSAVPLRDQLRPRTLYNQLFGGQPLALKAMFEVLQELKSLPQDSLEESERQQVADLVELGEANEQKCTGDFFDKMKTIHQTAQDLSSSATMVSYIDMLRSKLLTVCGSSIRKQVDTTLASLPGYFQSDMKKIGRSIMLNDDPYEGAAEGIANCYVEKKLYATQNEVKNTKMFLTDFNDRYGLWLTKLADELRDVSRMFETMSEDEDHEEAARKFYNLTDPKTFEWITYSRIAWSIIYAEEKFAGLSAVANSAHEQLVKIVNAPKA